MCFSTLLDIDELILEEVPARIDERFSTLLDIDELILTALASDKSTVLVLCWILMNLYLLYLYCPAE